MLRQYAAYATLPTSDLNRARAFYEEKLGLTPTEEGEAGLAYTYGGSSFMLFPSSGTASGDHTQAGWTVQDIESEVRELRARGVEFLEYDVPGMKTVNGIADVGGTRAAWFKDSEGNLLGLVQLG